MAWFFRSQSDENARATLKMTRLKWTRLVHSVFASEKKLRAWAVAESASSDGVARREVYISFDMVNKVCTSSLTDREFISKNAALFTRNLPRPVPR